MDNKIKYNWIWRINFPPRFQPPYQSEKICSKCNCSTCCIDGII